MENDDDYEQEKDLVNHSKSMSLEQLEMVANQMKNSVCKIRFKIGGKSGHGTGFFCNFHYDGWNSIKVLMTNNHVLNETQEKKYYSL